MKNNKYVENQPARMMTCQEYPDIKCGLGNRYPYCDMTCPMNRYVEKKIISDQGSVSFVDVSL